MFAIERQALGWLCIDPSRANFHCTILPAGYMDDVMTSFAALNSSSTVLQVFVQSELDEPIIYPKLGLISCVGVMQYTLGVYWPWILTPYQLYCRLVNTRISHIKAGKLWVATEQSAKHSQQQSNQPLKRSDTETNQQCYSSEQKHKL